MFGSLEEYQIIVESLERRRREQEERERREEEERRRLSNSLRPQ
jgi:hypothetical protein